jgi:transposase
MVEAGASRHEAAEHFGVSVSSVVKWMQRWSESRSAAPKPRGGSISPLEQQADRVVAVIAKQPDLTLEETAAELRRHRIRTSRSSLSRFFHRHDITFKKKPASCRARTSRCGSSAPKLDPRARLA